MTTRHNFLLTIVIILSLTGNAGRGLAADEPADKGGRSPSAHIKGTPWSGLHDPVLDELVQRALAGNPGIDAARARIDMAEAAAQSALAPLHPTVYAEGGYMLKNYDAPIISGMNIDSPDYMQSATVGLTAKYQIDITRRYTIAREASLKEVSASREDVQTQGMTIASLVVQNYYDVVAAQQRVKLIEAQIQNYETLLKLVMAQFNVGSATSLDVLQQRAQLESKKAQLPLAQTIAESGKVQLAALLDTSVESLPQIPDTLPGLPSIPSEKEDDRRLSELADARPSLRASKIRIEALELKETSARRALLPSLALVGQAGYQWNRINEWRHGDTWQIGATLTVPLYMGGANRAAIRQAQAATLNARYSMEYELLQARAKVLAAREAEKAQQAYLDALKEQTRFVEMTVEEATKRYLAGLSTTYLNVLTANDTLQLNQLNVLQAERNLLSARINLLEALGGNWTRKLVTD